MMMPPVRPINAPATRLQLEMSILVVRTAAREIVGWPSDDKSVGVMNVDGG